MFSKKSAPSEGLPPPRVTPSMASGSTFSVFGADIAITGDVRAEAELHVDGRIEGTEVEQMAQGVVTALDIADGVGRHYSTVTDFARLRGLSTSVPLTSAAW